MTELSAAEKRANAARINAFQALAKVLGQILQPVVSVVEVPLEGNRKILLSTCPAELAQIVAQQQLQLRQLEINLQCIVDMLLQSALLVAGPDGAPVRSNITMEQFWLLCAQSAEKLADTMQRGLLSQGAVRPASGIVLAN